MMKRCPKCYEAYEDSEKFCELDGQHLLTDPTLSVPITEEDSAGFSSFHSPRPQFSKATEQREIWFVGTAGVMLGIVVCVGGYLAYGIWKGDSGFKEPTAPAFASQAHVPIQPARPPAPHSEVPTPLEETASSEPDPSLEPPASSTTMESEAVAAKLNQGPVSTGERKKGAENEPSQTIIEMTDGTTVEVEAAWTDNQGVWYRRGGLVSFVEGQRVKAITARPEQKPARESGQ